jgi:hypothetical protein
VTVGPILVLIAGGNLIGLSNLVNLPRVYGDVQTLANWTHPLHIQTIKQMAHNEGISVFHKTQRTI